MQKQNMNWFAAVLRVVICFIILTELTSFLLSFQVLGKDSMDYGIRSGKTLRLGMPEAPQGNIQGRLKYLSLRMPRKASPLSSSKTISIPYLELYFYSSHDMCFAWSVFSFYLFFNKIIGFEILNERESYHGYLTF